MLYSALLSSSVVFCSFIDSITEGLQDIPRAVYVWESWVSLHSAVSKFATLNKTPETVWEDRISYESTRTYESSENMETVSKFWTLI